MSAYSLLLDIGGTDVKIGSSFEGKLIASTIRRRRMPTLQRNKDNYLVINPKELLEMISDFIENYISEFPSPTSIYITGQVGSWILTTGSGQFLTDIFSWQDTSFTAIPSHAYKEMFGNSFSAQTLLLEGNGGEDWPGAPWRGLGVVIPDNTHLKKPLFHSVLSWIAWELTGRKAHLIHNTDAAATGLVRIPEMDWIKFKGSLRDQVEMPEIVDEIRSIGNLNGTSVPVFIPIGDQQASILGVGISHERMVLNAGTGGQVVKLIGKHLKSNLKIRPFFKGEFVETITHIPSGRFLEKFLTKCNEHFEISYDWEWIWSDKNFNHHCLQESLSGISNWNYETFLEGYFEDKRCPLCARNKFLREFTGNFIVALERINAKETKEIVFAGGVAQKFRYLEQTCKEKYGLKISVSDSQETTLEGLNKVVKSSERNNPS